MARLSEDDRDNAEHYLKELENPLRALKANELGAVESWADEFERTGSLTERQFEKLVELHKRKCL